MSTSAPLRVFARRGALFPAQSRIGQRVCRASYSSSVASWSRIRCQAAAVVPTVRAFTTTRPRYLASEADVVDPISVERESDEVDVCIIGGGI